MGSLPCLHAAAFPPQDFHLDPTRICPQRRQYYRAQSCRCRLSVCPLVEIRMTMRKHGVAIACLVKSIGRCLYGSVTLTKLLYHQFCDGTIQLRVCAISIYQET